MSSTTENSTLSATKQALLRIRELKQQLAESEHTRNESIAIVSMSCRFPRQSNTPAAFWQSLIEGTDEVTDVPTDRWDLEAYYDADLDAPGKMYARRGAFLEKIDEMDADFFGISPREATWLDPQQRLLLEAGWEALERAGWTSELTGNDIGVFVGWMHNDYQNESSDSLLDLNPYIATGSAGSFLCGRLSYYLGIQGPSLAVDTACSSSLVALHLACQSLRQRECDRAIVGGVNVMTSPKTTVLTCKLHALSPQGHSRAFDASADGYLRGEGCGVVTLKRLSDAERDGDAVLAIVRGSAVTHNGLSSGLTAPNPDAQQKAIRAALAVARVAPTDVDYLEAHGTGTELGDPLEMQAAAAVLGEGRNRKRPLLVGSVKTNIGHLEAAAGMAGLIKVILSIQHGQIPRHLNFETPNPHIKWDELPVKIVTETTTWPDTATRIAGVSAFGMSGTNAHVVIEAPTSRNRQTVSDNASGNGAARTAVLADESTAAAKPINLLLVSGRTNDALQQLAGRYAEWLEHHPHANLSDICFTTGAARRHFERRAAVVPKSVDHAREVLGNLASGRSSSDIFLGQARRAPSVAWQFTGQGSQYLGLGKQLYETQPVFRKVLERCDERLREFRDDSLLQVMFEDEQRLHETTWTQPALFAIHLALAELMQSWGMRPDFVLGHSLGEYAAACVSGMLTWEDGLWLIHERSRLTGALPSGGAMAAIFASADRVQQAITACAEVSIAAYNGSHIVISGREEGVDAILQELKKDGVRGKRLKTSHAFHSALLDPMLDEFQKIADSIDYRSGDCPLIGNVTGAALPVEQTVDGLYWRRQLRKPVRYADSIQALADAGCDVVLELGPQPILTGMAAACWSGAATALIPSLQGGEDDSEAIATTLARLYTHGVPIDFAALQGSRLAKKVVLPTYPFQRKRFWGPAKPGISNVAKDTVHPLLGARLSLAGVDSEQRYETRLAPDQPRWLQDHAVFGDIVFPGAAYVEMAVAALGGRGVLENLAFEMPLRIQEPTSVQSIVRNVDEQQTIEIHSLPTSAQQWLRNCSCMIGAPVTETPPPVSRSELESRCERPVEVAKFYEMFFALGLHYGPQFQTIQSLSHNDTEILAKLQLVGDQRGFVIPPMLLDGAFQSLAVGLLQDASSSLFLPVAIERFQCFGPITNEVWSHAQWHDAEGDLRTADITLFDERGDVLAKVEKLKLRAVSRSALRQMFGSGPERLMYSIDWRAETLPESTTRPGRWLVVSDAQADAGEVVNELQSKGQLCIEVALAQEAGESTADDRRTTIVASERAAWDRLISKASTEPDGGLSGVIWLLHVSGGEKTFAERSAETELHCSGILALLHSLRALKVEWLERGLQLVTQSGVAVNEQDTVNSHAGQFWGFGRVIGTEHPALRCRVIDVEQINTETSSLVEVLLTDSRESQMALRAGTVFVPRLVPLRGKPEGESRVVVDAQGTYLITGGLGMLGRRAAEWLANRGAGHIVLVSRRQPSESAQESIAAIEEQGCRIHVKLADVGDAASVEQLVAEINSELPPLRGIIHAAGVLNDGILADQSWDSFKKVLAPKEVGAWTLHELTLGLPLDFFILYSSAASVLGSPGQANYAMANAFLDGLAHQRVAAGLPALSVNWGPWNEGMAATEAVTKGLARQGMTPLTSDEAHEVLERLMSSNAIQATVLDVDWGRMRERLRVQAPPMLDTVWPNATMDIGEAVLLKKLSEVQASARRDVVIAHVQSELQQILSLSVRPEPDTQLAELGLDSLMAVELSTRLQQQVGTQYAIPPTIAFDYPSIESLSDHLVELIKDAGETPEPTVVRAESKDEAIAIIGLGCRFPGADNVNEYWRVLRDGIDATSELPSGRWDMDQYFDPEPKAGKMYTRRGGFLQGLDLFDADFFGISEQEACWMDPQHRLLLETTWEAFENAGIAPQQMSDPLVGVFMGLMSTDYAQLHEHVSKSLESFQGAGFSHSAGVGRISHLFGFEGPSVAVDSASSSSLVAVCQAVKSLLDGECNLAVAGGVNAILSPTSTLLLCKAGMLSPDGRCKSFSAHADGFGRGEGCGIVLLKRLSDAEKDGDTPLALIRGTAVSHNGNSGALTAPSSRSQERMLRQALENAGLKPADVSYLEAHGTGTELGDPIELRAAAAVLGKGRNPEEPLLVGSAKANIGHLEAAGGISGLIKVVLSMQHHLIPPQIHFDQPSPHVPWEKIRARIVTDATPWPDNARRIAGVNALGMSGTNAHVIVEGVASRADTKAEDSPDQLHHLLILSARSPEALSVLAQRYARWFDESTDVDLADACYTTRVGRRHFEHRAAIVVDSVEHAVELLRSIADEDDATADLRGQASNSTKLGWLFGNSSTCDRVGRRLYDTQPLFRDVLDQCDQDLQSAHDASLLDVLFDEDAEVTDPSRSQLALLAVQMGLAQLWQSWGIEPDVVSGFGVGQYAAACAAGVMKWSDGFALAMKASSLATTNRDTAPTFEEKSLERFEQFADSLDYFPADRTLVCSLTGSIVPVHQLLAGNYWQRHLTTPIRFEDCCRTLDETGCHVFVEIGPPNSLPEFVPTKLTTAGQKLCRLASDRNELASMLQILGELYIRRTKVDFKTVDGSWKGAKLNLPTYPFQRKRYWLTDL